MKKMILFALMLTAGMCFSACSSDDDDNSNNNNQQQQTGENIPPAELEVFTDRVITVDALGNLKGVNVGTAIDLVSPTIFSVQVEDLAEAKAKFTELVKDFRDVSTSGNNITVTLRDSEGKEQGKVFFKEGNGNEVANMTFEGFTLQGISMLKYVTVWPASNAESRYKLLQVMTVPSDREGNPRGVCIREYKSGTNGMIICPTSYESGYQDWRTNTCLESMMQFGKRVKELGVSKVSEQLKKANIYSDLTKYYWSSTTKFYFFDVGHWKVRLSDGEDKYVSSWEVALPINNANNAYCYWFDANGHCW